MNAKQFQQAIEIALQVATDERYQFGPEDYRENERAKTFACCLVAALRDVDPVLAKKLEAIRQPHLWLEVQARK
jgi:hypothetical protein